MTIRAAIIALILSGCGATHHEPCQGIAWGHHWTYIYSTTGEPVCMVIPPLVMTL